jgi:hypothetical protein
MEIQGHQARRPDDVARISPFTQLPTELLGVIAKMYMEDRPKITTITQICSRLRRVVHGMRIWNRIKLLEYGRGFDAGYGYDSASEPRFFCVMWSSY